MATGIAQNHLRHGSVLGARRQDLEGIWAVQGGEGGLDDVTLHRWLQAENYNVDAAEKRLRAHAIWRKEEFPEGRVLEVPNSLTPTHPSPSSVLSAVLVILAMELVS